MLLLNAGSMYGAMKPLVPVTLRMLPKASSHVLQYIFIASGRLGHIGSGNFSLIS